MNSAGQADVNSLVPLQFFIVKDKNLFLGTPIKFHGDDVQVFMTKEGVVDTMKTHLPYLEKIEGLSLKEYRAKCDRVAAQANQNQTQNSEEMEEL